MQEIWKPVVGYEGLYEVSNLGNVKSFDRVVGAKANSKAIRKGRILSKTKTQKGYRQVCLYKDKKPKFFFIHQLVALSFIDNPLGRSMINHINEIRNDNRVENLEWTTYKENNNHGTRLERAIKTMTNGKRSIPVLMFKNGKFLRYFPSLAQVSRSLGFDASNVSRVLDSNRKSYGYNWKKFQKM